MRAFSYSHFQPRDIMVVTPFDPPYPKTQRFTQTSWLVIEAELLPIEVLHCGNRDFRRFLP